MTFALVLGAALSCLSTPSSAQCTGVAAANKFCASPPSSAGQFGPRALVAGDLPAALAFTGKTVTGGTFTGAAWDNGTIGGTTPAAGRFTDLETTQTFKLGGVITPPQITSDQNNYSPAGFATATVLRLDTNASRTISGLVAGVEGRVVVIQNIGANDLKLLNESATSTAPNRLAIFSDATLNPNTSTALRYDATSQRWRSVAGAGSGSGSGGGVSQVTISAGTGITVSGTCTITSIGTCAIGLTTPIAATLGGTGVASPTSNTIPINQGASPQTNTGIGNWGECLAGRSGSSPVFKAGCRILLNTMTASSSAALTDTATFTTYGALFDDFEIVMDYLIPGTTGVWPLIEVSSGAVFQATGYLTALATNTNGAFNATGPTTHINLTNSGANLLTNVAATGGYSGTWRVHKPTGTTNAKRWSGNGGYTDGTSPFATTGSGAWNSTAALDGFRVRFSSGVVATGVVKIYGIK